MEVPLQTSGEEGPGLRVLDLIKRSTRPWLGQARALGAGPLPAAGPSGLRCPVQPAALWKLEAVPLLPFPYPGQAVPRSRAVGQERA